MVHLNGPPTLTHSPSQVPLIPNAMTVGRWLKAEGVYSCWAAGKPLLTTRHIETRLLFANAHMGFNFYKVVFSDEKIWRIRQGGKVRVWRRKGKRFDARYTVPTVAKAEGVMVWCAINGLGQVVVRRCPTTMDSKGYQEVLQSALHFIRPRFVTTSQDEHYYIILHIPQGHQQEGPLPAGRGERSPVQVHQGVVEGQGSGHV